MDRGGSRVFPRTKNLWWPYFLHWNCKAQGEGVRNPRPPWIRVWMDNGMVALQWLLHDRVVIKMETIMAFNPLDAGFPDKKTPCLLNWPKGFLHSWFQNIASIFVSMVHSCNVHQLTDKIESIILIYNISVLGLILKILHLSEYENYSFELCL